MNLFINGEERNVPGIGTVGELLENLNLASGLVLVEQNGYVVQRAQFQEQHCRGLLTASGIFR